MIVYDGTLPEETINKERESVEGFLRENADFEKTDQWGRRDLAYEINKKRVGNYCLFLYTSEGAVPGQLEKTLKLNENVLRYLSIRRTEQKAEPAKEKAAEAAEEAPTAEPTSEKGEEKAEEKADA
jgi:small subunit ribosomal protein S6